MLYAIVNDAIVEATEKGMHGVCRTCNEKVISAIGSRDEYGQLIEEAHSDHWRHATGTNCDRWIEPETDWHKDWKKIIKPEHVQKHVEVTIKRNGKIHRADIVGENGVVIEVQHSAISHDDIAARERFYSDMIWMFDASVFNGLRHIKSGNKLLWEHPRSFAHSAKKPIYLDFKDSEASFVSWPNNIFRVSAIELPYLIGSWITREEFVWQFARSFCHEDIRDKGIEHKRARYEDTLKIAKEKYATECDWRAQFLGYKSYDKLVRDCETSKPTNNGWSPKHNTLSRDAQLARSADEFENVYLVQNVLAKLKYTNSDYTANAKQAFENIYSKMRTSRDFSLSIKQLKWANSIVDNDTELNCIYDLSVNNVEYTQTDDRKHALNVNFNVIRSNKKNIKTTHGIDRTWVFTNATRKEPGDFAKASGIKIPNVVSRTVLEDWSRSIIGARVRANIVHRQDEDEVTYTLCPALSVKT